MSYTILRPVQMVRLSNLDSPDGPTVGATVTVDAAPQGAYRPDIAFESIPGGGTRGAILWSRRSGDTNYKRWGTLVPTSSGMRVVARGVSDGLRVFSHSAGAPPTSWSSGSAGIKVAANGPA